MTAPKIEAIPSTPAHEWASETLSSVPTASNDTGTNSLVGGIQETLYNATVTAAQYLPTKVVEYIPGGAAITAASDTERLQSQSSSSLGKPRDAQGISLPSQEPQGSLASKGVGSLPGPASEAGVAKLPLEREIEDNATKGQSSGKETQDNRGTTKSHAEREWESMMKAASTSKGASLARKGMAKLPLGKGDSSSYAELEWEAMNGTTKPSSTSDSTESKSLMKSLPQVPQSKSTSPEAGKISPSSPSTTRSSIFSRTKHPKKSSSSSGSISSGNGDGTSGSLRKKTKLLTKLRGEAKIITGKLSGKEEKVAEGRRIVKGEV